jgi:hypothetical protein
LKNQSYLDKISTNDNDNLDTIKKIKSEGYPPAVMDLLNLAKSLSNIKKIVNSKDDDADLQKISTE